MSFIFFSVSLDKKAHAANVAREYIVCADKVALCTDDGSLSKVLAEAVRGASKCLIGRPK